MVFLSHPYTHQNGAAQTHQGAEGGQQRHDRAADAHTGQSQSADAGDMSDIDPVDNTVQDIDKLGDHGGYSQAQHQGRGGIIL